MLLRVKMFHGVKGGQQLLCVSSRHGLNNVTGGKLRVRKKQTDASERQCMYRSGEKSPLNNRANVKVI